MKHTKTLLALLLAALLALGVGVPAMAVSAGDIKISITGPDTVPYGEAFTLNLSIDEPLPEGVEITNYRWRAASTTGTILEGPEEATLHVTSKDSFYPWTLSRFLNIEFDATPYLSKMAMYECRVTFVEKDSEGNAIETKTIYVVHNILREAKREITFFDKLFGSAFGMAYAWFVVSVVGTGGLGLLFFPITLVVGFLFGFFGFLFGFIKWQ